MKPVCCKVNLGINNDPGGMTKGLFLGLISDSETGDPLAVVWLPDMGMMLHAYHPSKVILTPGEPT